MSQSAPKPTKRWNNKSSRPSKRNRRKLEEVEDFRKPRPTIKPQPLNKRKVNKRDKKRQEREAQDFPGLVNLLSEEARSLSPGSGILKFLNASDSSAPDKDGNETPDNGFISLDASDDETILGKQFAQYEDENTGFKNQFPCPWLTQIKGPDASNAGEEHKGDEAGTKTRGLAQQIGDEVVEFLKYMSPSANEIRTRESCLTRLRNLVRQLWPSATVAVFGSYATGMYLPDADMDVVILSNEMRANLRSEMYRLSARLKSNVAEQVQVISHARVPIIKYVESGTGLSVDIAFGQQNGLETAGLVSSWLNENQVLKPLAMVIRQFLKRRGLSEVANGGVGGYATICMVYSRLQQRLPQVESDILGNVGLLLLDFFNYYGHEFDNTSQIVRPQKAPRCSPIPKRKNGSMATPQASGLAIEDPNDDNNNISKASFNYVAVKRSFANAADYMKALCIEWQRLPQRQRSSISFLAPLLKFSGNELERSKASLEDALSTDTRNGTRPGNEQSNDKSAKMTKRPGSTDQSSGSNDQSSDKRPGRRININSKPRTSDERGKGVKSYDLWKEIYSRSESSEPSSSSNTEALAETEPNANALQDTAELPTGTGEAATAKNGTSTSESSAVGSSASGVSTSGDSAAEDTTKRHTNGHAKDSRDTKHRGEKARDTKRSRDNSDDDDSDSRTKLTTAQRRQFWTRKAGTPEASVGTAQASD